MGVQSSAATVWLTEWQVGDDSIEVRDGDEIAWTVITADASMFELLDGRRDVDFELDTSAQHETVPDPGFLDLRGRVSSVEAVLVTRHQHAIGQIPDPHATRFTTVDSTFSLHDREPIAGFIVTCEPGATVTLHARGTARLP